MVTGVGPEVLSGGVYDQLQVPAASSLVTVPSEAVSATVLRPWASSKVPLVVANEPSLTVRAGWMQRIVGAVLFSTTLSSSDSTARRARAGTLRMVRGVREANNSRSQERMGMERLLRVNVGSWGNTGAGQPGAHRERPAGKSLPAAISQRPPVLLVPSMRNREWNRATKCLAFPEGERGLAEAGLSGLLRSENRARAWPPSWPGCGCPGIPSRSSPGRGELVLPHPLTNWRGASAPRRRRSAWPPRPGFRRLG